MPIKHWIRRQCNGMKSFVYKSKEGYVATEHFQEQLFIFVNMNNKSALTAGLSFVWNWIAIKQFDEPHRSVLLVQAYFDNQTAWTIQRWLWSSSDGCHHRIRNTKCKHYRCRIVHCAFRWFESNVSSSVSSNLQRLVWKHVHKSTLRSGEWTVLALYRQSKQICGKTLEIFLAQWAHI